MAEENDDGNDESNRGKLSNLLACKVVPLSLMKGMESSSSKLCELLSCESRKRNSVCLMIGNQGQKNFSRGFTVLIFCLCKLLF